MIQINPAYKEIFKYETNEDKEIAKDDLCDAILLIAKCIYEIDPAEKFYIEYVDKIIRVFPLDILRSIQKKLLERYREVLKIPYVTFYDLK